MATMGWRKSSFIGRARLRCRISIGVRFSQSLSRGEYSCAFAVVSRRCFALRWRISGAYVSRKANMDAMVIVAWKIDVDQKIQRQFVCPAMIAPTIGPTAAARFWTTEVKPSERPRCFASHKSPSTLVPRK